MPADIKAIFRPEAVFPRLKAFTLPPGAAVVQRKLAGWAKLLDTKRGQKMKETELRDEFLFDVFRDLLGYSTAAQGPAAYTFKKEQFVEVDGTFADAGFGRFGGPTEAFVAVLEGKGPSDPLDRPHAGRKRPAFEQALLYAYNLRIDWFLVTNLNETRLYCKRADQFTYERFDTTRLAEDEHELKRFVFLLGAERVAPASGKNHLDDLLTESRRIGRELTNDYYREYRELRERTFDALRLHNPDRLPADLLTKTQKLLDRILFIAFAEDRDLLPPDSIKHAYEHEDEYNPRPVWHNFRVLFQWVDTGNSRRGVTAYNGGLFHPDVYLDALVVPDQVCGHFKRLADYEYGHAADGEARLIDVEILGHIFEQSITDLEEMRRSLTPAPAEKPGPSKRKREGAFYTPAFVTRYIVAETLGPVLRERFEAFRQQQEAKAPRTTKKVFADPKVFDLDALTEPQRTALQNFWEGWLGELETVRIVDPACGSGAFLIEAFDQLFAEYRQAQAFLVPLIGHPILFDVPKAILTNNLFGVDLNGEAVEIARLSCWIKTAERDKQLSSLDDNITQGNSVVAEPTPREAWRARFPAIFAAGGFDVVIGNPPYVRQEWISADKPFLRQHYRAFDSVADLYVYFYELGLSLLRPGGRLGLVTTNKWLKAGYGEPLRKLLGESAWVESVVDFGHAKEIFPDADVFPSILVVRKPNDGPGPQTARACVIPREQLRIDDLSRQIATEGVAVPRSRFGATAWNLEPPGVAAVLEKLKAAGAPLKDVAGTVPLMGIKTGFNDAFLIDTPTKEQLVRDDPKSAPLFRRYLRGQDIQRWQAEWGGSWMLVLRSSGNHAWPWANAGAQAEAVFEATYPAIHAHLNQHRDALMKRQDQGEHWWELRACAYWSAFDGPKIMYQEIQFHPCYMLDETGLLSNNKAFFLPADDLYLLGVLNSPLMWWHNHRYLPHMKDEALTPVTFKMEALPIARPSDEIREGVTIAVRRLIGITAEQHSGWRDFLAWLRTGLDIAKPSQKLDDGAGLDADGLIAEVRKVRGRSKPLSVAEVKRLNEEHGRSVVPLQTLRAEALGLERRVSDLVNAAYGLTPEDVRLLWATAPPRMPIPAPAPA
jgi:hypothetical protein